MEILPSLFGGIKYQRGFFLLKASLIRIDLIVAHRQTDKSKVARAVRCPGMGYLRFDIRCGHLSTCNNGPGWVGDKSGQRSYTCLRQDADRLGEKKENKCKTQAT